MKNIYIKNADNDITKELNSVKFDKCYLEKIKSKYKGCAFKIFNLKPYEANILKQLCLSLGFDCAINRDSITCKCEYTDAIIFATFSQYEKLCNKLNEQPFRLKELSKELKKVIDSSLLPLKIRSTIFDWKRPYIMGILNITPDSFSDGGKYNSLDKATEHAKLLLSQGTDIIDIGGESTRPGCVKISVEEEINRVIPVIESIRSFNSDIVISIDTYNYKTAKLAIEKGADIINDVSGFEFDTNLSDFAIKNNIPSIIMYSGKLDNDYDLVEQVYCFFENKIRELTARGMSKSNIIIDCGIGFNKTESMNFEFLTRMNEFQSLGCPILLGISRKSFIRNKFNIDFEESDIVTALYSSLLKSVNIHRVHNVEKVKKFLEYSNAI